MIGADISKAMLRVAQQKSRASLVQFDAEAPCLPAHSIDCAILLRFFGHLPADARQHILQQLRPICTYLIIELSMAAHRSPLRLWDTVRGRRHLWQWHTFAIPQLHESVHKADWKIMTIQRKLPLISNSAFVLLG